MSSQFTCLQIQNSLETDIELVTPAREFLREGLLKLKTSSGKTMHCYLFNDLFLITTTSSSVWFKKKEELFMLLDLQNLILKNEVDSEGGCDSIIHSHYYLRSH